MKDNRATRILGTVFHKHKYINNPGITPEDRVITTAGKLADDIKGCMPTHLSKTTLEKLERIGTILKQGWTQKDQQHPTGNPPTPPPSHNHKVQVELPLKVGVGVPVPRKVSNLHLLLKPPKPAPLVTPVISSTIMYPRVVPPPRVMPPPREAPKVTPRQSP